MAGLSEGWGKDGMEGGRYRGYRTYLISLLPCGRGERNQSRLERKVGRKLAGSGDSHCSFLCVHQLEVDVLRMVEAADEGAAEGGSVRTE